MSITLYGSVRGKTVASLAHAFALSTYKLSLNPATVNAPWRPVGGKPIEYFVWRKALVAEREELRLTLAGLMGGEVIEPGTIAWSITDGKSLYYANVAAENAQIYARMIVKALWLANG